MKFCNMLSFIESDQLIDCAVASEEVGFDSVCVSDHIVLPETINWMLSDEYHAPAAVGGHVRIYTATELKAKLRSAGIGTAASHHAHALHSPYWWLRCAVGVDDDDHPIVRRYRRFLEWDIVRQPRSTRIADRMLSPLLGKSLVLYGIAQ